jgi:hypothetical protein
MSAGHDFTASTFGRTDSSGKPVPFYPSARSVTTGGKQSSAARTPTKQKTESAKATTRTID